MCMILSAARTGTVLFSTTILLLCAVSAIIRAALSTYFKSAARPRPLPFVFVGVFTEMKINSASLMAVFTSVLKNKFTFRHFFTTSSSPGYECTRKVENERKTTKISYGVFTLEIKGEKKIDVRTRDKNSSRCLLSLGSRNVRLSIETMRFNIKWTVPSLFYQQIFVSFVRLPEWAMKKHPTNFSERRKWIFRLEHVCWHHNRTRQQVDTPFGIRSANILPYAHMQYFSVCLRTRASDWLNFLYCFLAFVHGIRLSARRKNESFANGWIAIFRVNDSNVRRKMLSY